MGPKMAGWIPPPLCRVVLREYNERVKKDASQGLDEWAQGQGVYLVGDDAGNEAGRGDIKGGVPHSDACGGDLTGEGGGGGVGWGGGINGCDVQKKEKDEDRAG